MVSRRLAPVEPRLACPTCEGVKIEPYAVGSWGQADLAPTP